MHFVITGVNYADDISHWIKKWHFAGCVFSR